MMVDAHQQQRHQSSPRHNYRITRRAEDGRLDATAAPSLLSTAGRHSPSNVRQPIDTSTAKADKHTEAGFHERYTLGRVIGCGAFSVVRVAVERATGREWACKVVTEAAERPLLLREVDILKQLYHPCLLQYHDHFDTPEGLYIITELLEGSDLLGAALLQRGSYCSEDDARDIIRQVLSALAYLDSKDVAHRDLKIDNIMLVTRGNGTKGVKIIDFGLADQLTQDKPSFSEACGTPLYVAPEVALRVPYGTSCDVWAAGVVLFMLLSYGDYPFEGRSVKELLRNICSAAPCFRHPVWGITSSGAKSLVETLLRTNPAMRGTAEEALMHPWLTDK